MEATTQTQQTPGKWRVHEWKDRISITDGDGWQEILWDSDWRGGYRARETEIERARLICAAVNAVREAGYTVEDLERGQLKGDHELADRKWANMDEKAMDEWERDRADLAACREALKECAGHLDADDNANFLGRIRALLARLDA